ncbi:hypothetical protein Bra471DRAFT_01402 [Bradyrhizobium sp. WSM471]|nr:hypothetical protein Bra471DRAFT_01402 [Bradyrhizobium sp. WSM471]
MRGNALFGARSGVFWPSLRRARAREVRRNPGAARDRANRRRDFRRNSPEIDQRSCVYGRRTAERSPRRSSVTPRRPFVRLPRTATELVRCCRVARGILAWPSPSSASARPVTIGTRTADFTRAPRYERTPFAALTHRRGSVDVTSGDFPCLAVSERLQDRLAQRTARATTEHESSEPRSSGSLTRRSPSYTRSGLQWSVHGSSASAINGRQGTAPRFQAVLTSQAGAEISDVPVACRHSICRNCPQSALATHVRAATSPKSTSEQNPPWRCLAGSFRRPASLRPSRTPSSRCSRTIAASSETASSRWTVKPTSGAR